MVRPAIHTYLNPIPGCSKPKTTDLHPQAPRKRNHAVTSTFTPSTLIFSNAVSSPPVPRGLYGPNATHTKAVTLPEAWRAFPMRSTYWRAHSGSFGMARPFSSKLFPRGRSPIGIWACGPRGRSMMVRHISLWTDGISGGMGIVLWLAGARRRRKCIVQNVGA